VFTRRPDSCDVDIICAKCLYMDVKLKSLVLNIMDRALVKLLMNVGDLEVSSRLTVDLRI
jgi:hypothetical protein